MNTLCPGEVLAFKKGPFTHYLIVSERGSAIFNSLTFGGKVVEKPLPEVLDRRNWWSIGYPGALPFNEVIRSARSQIGKPWAPWNNCEHFYKWAHGLKPESKQWQAVLMMFAIGGLAVLVARSK